MEELQREFSILAQCLYKIGGGVMVSPQEINGAQNELLSFPSRCSYYGILLLHVSLYDYIPFRNRFCVSDNNMFNCSIHFPLHQIIQQESQLKNVILNPAVRQLSAVLLKGYIKTHWNTITSADLKKQFKDLLPLGLMVGDFEVDTPPAFLSKINTAFGMSISEAAEHEFPEEWNDLIQILINIYENGLTNQQNFAQSLGALKCLSLVAQHFSDKHTIFVFPVLVPYMLKIAENAQLPDIIRAKALTVCSEMFSLIAMVSGDVTDEDDEYVDDYGDDGVYEEAPEEGERVIDDRLIEESKKLLATALEPTMNIVLGEICKPIPNVESDCSFKMECVKMMNTLIKEFGKTLQQAIIVVLQSTCISLEKEYETYFKHAVLSPSESGIPTKEIAARYDSEGENVNFTTVICQQIELLATIVLNPKLSTLLSSSKANLVQLIYLLIGYSQLPESMTELWETEPEQFVSEEDNQYSSYSIRIACAKLIEDFHDTYDNLAVESLLEAYHKRMQESQNLYIQNSNSCTWWKLREACLMCISSFTGFRDSIEDYPKIFDLPSLMNQLVQNDLKVNTESLQFLKSRAIQCSSFFLGQISNTKLYKINSLELIKQLFIIYVNHLNEQQPLPLRLYSCQAVARIFCLHSPILEPLISSFGQGKDEILQNILFCMCKLVDDLTDETMYIPLESIAVFVNFLPHVVVPQSANVISIMLNQLDKFSNDHAISSDIINVFDKLAQIPETEAQLVNNVIPRIAQIFTSSGTATKSDFVENLLNLSNTIIVRAKKEDSITILNSLFPSLMSLGFSNEDPSWIQKINECLRSIVHVSEEILVQHRFTSQNHQVSSFHFLLEYIYRLLQPNFSESAAFGVGELITEIFTKLGTALNMEIIGKILSACIVKLNVSEELIFIQSIVFVFAKLFHHQDVVQMFNLLESIKVGDSNGLVCLLNKWSKNQQFFFGAYKLKVTATALAKLLQTGDERLGTVTVSVEIEKESSGKYRTRSKSKTKERQMPFVLHAFVLLVDAFVRAKENENDKKKEYSAESVLYGGEPMGTDSNVEDDYLHQLVDDDFDDDEEEYFDDVLSSKDPINNVNLIEILPQVMKELCQVNQQVLPHLEKMLTTEQKNALKEMLNK
ncbi:importin-9 [Naegleria gruberi]|uniref:Importin-9 n=1 Tax=Naegleria gruberi TaxID=5762 RepID=D2V2K1_NAEGR|nr:importin-9 [Naegleria gruberi]EFC49074.1 importin-9 [Naegleria gruberi]|eukprot:XP_002681818.1 importin-9 [Naegleria gruberi]